MIIGLRNNSSGYLYRLMLLGMVRVGHHRVLVRHPFYTLYFGKEWIHFNVDIGSRS